MLQSCFRRFRNNSRYECHGYPNGSACRAGCYSSQTVTHAKRTYMGEIAKLARLETFDPAAFLSDDKAIREVGDFIVALALAFNDLKDLLFGESLLLAQAPADEKTPSPELGM